MLFTLTLSIFHYMKAKEYFNSPCGIVFSVFSAVLGLSLMDSRSSVSAYVDVFNTTDMLSSTEASYAYPGQAILMNLSFCPAVYCANKTFEFL